MIPDIVALGIVVYIFMIVGIIKVVGSLKKSGKKINRENESNKINLMNRNRKELANVEWNLKGKLAVGVIVVRDAF